MAICRGRANHAENKGGVMSAMTLEAAVQHVVSTDPTFAVTQVQVRGTTFKAFQNIPPIVPALLAAGWARHGGRRGDRANHHC